MNAKWVGKEGYSLIGCRAGVQKMLEVVVSGKKGIKPINGLRSALRSKFDF